MTTPEVRRVGRDDDDPVMVAYAANQAEGEFPVNLLGAEGVPALL